MKKILILLLALSSIACRHTAKKITDPKMPAISMLLLDSTTRIHAEDIPAGEPVIFLYFQPDCPHCQEETNEILQNIASLKDVRLYMLTPKYRPLLKSFYEHYKLANYKNITVGVDEGMIFYDHFQAKHIPFLAVFNKDKRLVQTHTGAFSMEKLLKNVQE